MNNVSKKSADVLMKWDWLWVWMFYITLLISMAFYLIDDSRSTSIWLAWLLSIGLILWHWLGMKWAYKEVQAWEDQPSKRLTIIIGDILFWFILVGISPIYYFSLLGFFPQIFRNLPIRFAVTAVVLLFGGMLYRQIEDTEEVLSLSSPIIWTFIFGGVGALLLGNWISAIIQQSAERIKLINQLEIAQSELSEAKRREGALEERQRLAGEIHDTLAQGFTSIVMLLENAEQTLPSEGGSTAGDQIKLARDTARKSLEQARRMVWELRPEPLEQATILEAYKRVSKAWQERSGIKANLNTTGKIISLHPEIEIALLRTLQEALHNIEKHAKATHTNITLSYMHDLIVLDVTDNGIGFEQNEGLPDGHFGLTVMRERIEKLNGSVKIESEINQGTALVIEIPIVELI